MTDNLKKQIAKVKDAKASKPVKEKKVATPKVVKPNLSKVVKEILSTTKAPLSPEELLSTIKSKYTDDNLKQLFATKDKMNIDEKGNVDMLATIKMRINDITYNIKDSKMASIEKSVVQVDDKTKINKYKMTITAESSESKE